MYCPDEDHLEALAWREAVVPEPPAPVLVIPILTPGGFGQRRFRLIAVEHALAVYAEEP